MIFLFVGILFVFAFVVIFKRIKDIEISKRIFFVDCKHSSFKLLEVLTNLIKMKMQRRIELMSFIDRNLFDRMGLIEAPVYVVDAKILGACHLKLFQKALINFKEQLNFIVLDGEIFVDNDKINCVSLRSTEITYKELALLNCLNINYVDYKSNRRSLNTTNKFNLKSKKTDKCHFYNFENAKFDLNSYLEKGVGYIKIKEKSKLFLKLPDSCFGYILNGRKNEVEVYTIFKELVVTVKGSFKAELNECVVMFDVNKANRLQFFVEQLKSCDDLKLFDLNIKYHGFEKEFKKLKDLALKELHNNFFITTQKVESFKVKSLTDFFKCSFLRKCYFNDYLFLLKKVFGLRLQNNVLTVNPNEIITNDFSIEYDYNGEKVELNYSKANQQNVKLVHVGHRIGVRDNFVYDF